MLPCDCALKKLIFSQSPLSNSQESSEVWIWLSPKVLLTGQSVCMCTHTRKKNKGQKALHSKYTQAWRQLFLRWFQASCMHLYSCIQAHAYTVTRLTFKDRQLIISCPEIYVKSHRYSHQMDICITPFSLLTPRSATVVHTCC